MASQPQPCPPGVAALGVSLKQLKAYGLSTGPTLFDVVPSGLVEKAFALDEAGRLGYMSAFNAHKAAIKVRLCGARAVARVVRRGTDVLHHCAPHAAPS